MHREHEVVVPLGFLFASAAAFVPLLVGGMLIYSWLIASAPEAMLEHPEADIYGLTIALSAGILFVPGLLWSYVVAKVAAARESRRTGQLVATRWGPMLLCALAGLVAGPFAAFIQQASAMAAR